MCAGGGAGGHSGGVLPRVRDRPGVGHGEPSRDRTAPPRLPERVPPQAAGRSPSTHTGHRRWFGGYCPVAGRRQVGVSGSVVWRRSGGAGGECSVARADRCLHLSKGTHTHTHTHTPARRVRWKAGAAHTGGLQHCRPPCGIMGVWPAHIGIGQLGSGYLRPRCDPITGSDGSDCGMRGCPGRCRLRLIGSAPKAPGAPHAAPAVRFGSEQATTGSRRAAPAGREGAGRVRVVWVSCLLLGVCPQVCRHHRASMPYSRPGPPSCLPTPQSGVGGAPSIGMAASP